MAELHIPGLSLVVLVGASGSGKTTFARRAFAPFEVISSDYCRALVSGDENDQSASGDAFDVLHYIAGKRLDRGLLTVVDATNVSRESRVKLVELARAHDVLPVAIVLDVPLEVALERNATRPDRDFGPGPVKRQTVMLRKSLRGLGREGFRTVHVLKSVEEVDRATIVRDRLLNDYSDQHGPFDIIGDIHGCLDELLTLLGILGYEIHRDEQGRAVDAEHPAGRRVVFVGDLVDRGPSSVGVLRLAMGMTAAGHALAVPGNHEAKLVRALDGRNVQATHGLETTLAELAEETPEFRDQVREWCRALVSHLVLDDRRLVVAHAGLKEAYHGRASGRVRSFALYGDTTGETDEYGLPVRYPWADEYRGRATVVYGHTPTPVLEWINNTLCLDTGCVFGGSLSAMRYPERETVQVPAEAVHYEPVKPFPTAPPQRGEDELRLGDVVGRRSVETGVMGRVTITAENAAGALEVMSRFALHPRLVPYLPPTMSPVATSTREGYLEHPDEAFAQFAEWGIGRVVCEEKHMGSRAVVYLTPDGGSVYTRTGRAFFDADLTTQLLERVRAAVRAGLDGVQLAVFQVLAGAGEAYADRDHLWHLDVADRLVAADPDLFRATRRLLVDVDDPAGRAEGVAWWEGLTADGGEGMVVKPLANLVRRSKGKAPQPGLKVRGREYLRIIYGPDYAEPENLERLRQRNLGRKRSLALREYALGVEAVERLVAGEPLWRVHEAVFGVLALESEPVDPRL